MSEGYEQLMNLQINTQLIPPSDPLMVSMPSGRDMYTTQPFVPPVLDEDTLARMRAPPDREWMAGDHDDSSSDEGDKTQQSKLPGSFPGLSATPSNSESYY